MADTYTKLFYFSTPIATEPRKGHGGGKKRRFKKKKVYFCKISQNLGQCKKTNIGQCTSGSVWHNGDNHNNGAHTPDGEV